MAFNTMANELKAVKNTRSMTKEELKSVCINEQKGIHPGMFDRVYEVSKGHPCSMCNTKCLYNRNRRR